jgi:exosortase/archaeosortase family protein
VVAYVLSRVIACAGLCALATAAYQGIFRIRVFEAWLSSHVVALGASVRTGYWRSAPGVWFAPNSSGQVRLLITSESSVAVLVILFLLITAGAVWRRTPLRWPLAALMTAVALLVAINQLRLLTVVWFILAMGDDRGFYWGHTLAGPVITGAGIAASLAAYSTILLRRGSDVRSR